MKSYFLLATCSIALVLAACSDDRGKLSAPLSAEALASSTTTTASYGVAGANNNSLNSSSTTVDDDVVISTIRNVEIQIKIIDAVKFKSTFQDESLVILNGKVGTVESFNAESLAGATSCIVDATHPTDWQSVLVKGYILNVLSSAEQQGRLTTDRHRLTLVLGDGTLAISCITSKNAQFTIKELRSTFSGIAEFTVIH